MCMTLHLFNFILSTVVSKKKVKSQISLPTASKPADNINNIMVLISSFCHVKKSKIPKSS